jgi:LysM repeat protein
MSSIDTFRRFRRIAGWVAVLGLCLTACAPSTSANEVRYSPPPSLALVALVDPSSGKLSDELRQLQNVIRTSATPGEAVVVMILQPSFASTYVVQSGDSLDKIAKAHDLSLSALEAANPQLGPLSGRNWRLIHPNERVLIPDGASQEALLLVTRAPVGPPPPMLIRIPAAPQNPTDFQRAQYNHKVAADTATNDARIAAWKDKAQADVQQWQAQVVDQLGKKAGSADPAAPRPDRQMLSASLTAGVTTLQGLNGRRMLLLLGGGELGPGALTPNSLQDVNLVIANLSDTRAAAAWTTAASGAGAASVKALDVALTRLQLNQVVNH